MAWLVKLLLDTFHRHQNPRTEHFIAQFLTFDWRIRVMYILRPNIKSMKGRAQKMM